MRIIAFMFLFLTPPQVLPMPSTWSLGDASSSLKRQTPVPWRRRRWTGGSKGPLEKRRVGKRKKHICIIVYHIYICICLFQIYIHIYICLFMYTNHHFFVWGDMFKFLLGVYQCMFVTTLGKTRSQRGSERSSCIMFIRHSYFPF